MKLPKNIRALSPQEAEKIRGGVTLEETVHKESILDEQQTSPSLFYRVVAGMGECLRYVFGWRKAIHVPGTGIRLPANARLLTQEEAAYSNKPEGMTIDEYNRQQGLKQREREKIDPQVYLAVERFKQQIKKDYTVDDKSMDPPNPYV